MDHANTEGTLINVVRLTAAAGKTERLRTAILATVAPGLAASGNLGFTVHVSDSDDRSFLIFEQWTNADALAKHESEPEHRAFQKLAQEEHLIEGEPARTHWKALA